MEKRLTQREILRRLISSGRLTEAEARELREAPEWVLPIKELVSYLAGLLIAAGVVRIAIYAFEGASALVIALVLYVVALLAAIFSFRFEKKTGALKRLGEFLELAAMLTGALATGIVLTEAGLRSEVSAIICSSVTFLWSLWRLQKTDLVGSVGVIPSIFVLSIMVTSEIDALQEQPPYIVGLAGVILVAIGLFQIKLAPLVRVCGLILVAQAAIGMAGYHHGGFAVLVPIGLGAIAYSYGAVRFQVEMLVVGAIMIVAGVVMFAVMNIDNDVAQGLVISATGLVILGATFFVAQQRRKKIAATAA